MVICHNGYSSNRPLMGDPIVFAIVFGLTERPALGACFMEQVFAEYEGVENGGDT
jgi:hypothetical protein